MASLQIKLTPELSEKLSTLCKKTGDNKNDLVVNILNKALNERLEKEIFEDIQQDIQNDQIKIARTKLEKAVSTYPKSEHLLKLQKVMEFPEVISYKLSLNKSRDKTNQWLQENSEKYRGKWIALYKNQLVAADISLKVVINFVKKKHDLKDIFLHQIAK